MSSNLSSHSNKNEHYYRNRLFVVLFLELIVGIMLVYFHFNFSWQAENIYTLIWFIFIFILGIITSSIFFVRQTSSSSKSFVVILFSFVVFSIFTNVMLFAVAFKTCGLLESTSSGFQPVRDELSAKSLYFSIITFTTVGYGDFVPSANSRFFAATEALTNFISIAVLIASASAFIRRFALTPDEIRRYFPNEDSLE